MRRDCRSSRGQEQVLVSRWGDGREEERTSAREEREGELRDARQRGQAGQRTGSGRQ